MPSGEHSLPLASLQPGLPFVLALVSGLLLLLALRYLLLRWLSPDRFHKYTNAAEELLLTVLFLTIVLFSCLQLVLRNFFHSGLIWVDPLLRYIVLWIGFLGALAATSHGRHIAIDLIPRMVPRTRPWLHRLAALAAAAICLALANGAYEYLRQEIEFGRETLLGIRSWQLQSILLLGFFLLAYRFLVYIIWGVWKKTAEAEGEEAA